jgi:hypothetical protein
MQSVEGLSIMEEAIEAHVRRIQVVVRVGAMFY